MSPGSWTATALPWLVVAWIVTVTVIVVAALIYLIMRAVISKTEPQKLPEVLRALTPLLRDIVQSLTRPAASRSFEVSLSHDTQIRQTSNAPVVPTEETS